MEKASTPAGSRLFTFAWLKKQAALVSTFS
jgi:hypothetical protein